MKGNKITASILLLSVLVCTFFTGKAFKEMWEKDLIVQGDGVTEIRMLSDYNPSIKGTAGDTEVYVMKGAKDGASMLVLGGTHANEPSGYLTAVTLIENAQIEEGTLYVIPRANNSAFTHNDPQEGAPQFFEIATESGIRRFTFGSRATNPIHQWPDPDVYVHSSGQKLSGSETRNLNRGYPGDKNGSFTEQICFGIAELIRTEKITMEMDLHEASPEYPVINALVSHEKAMNISSMAIIDLQLQGINMGIEPSPVNLRGLSHRELGDATETLAMLMETANPSQGRLRGKTNEELILTGKDKFYEKAFKAGRLYVPFDSLGHPLEVRVGRQIVGILSVAKAYSDQNEANLIIKNLPAYDDIVENGVGAYLN
ncbi:MULTISPECIES: succinylglutamate desuccinylase [unclassified Fusibacter]|uniref:succinylglutamate desuccinylase n=1 Tax=unclassified Fusibacter TaxID=2624464 RepID=UPI001012CB6D|nr:MULTISPECIES: succinylglutamate desuccinylase [unclassified Fusibacter]MCK8061068.1 succinylglutamate desuccinylase [Fusibacter sp. A2]NPE20478.1 succinylglutamate desuccinylase [Fusibacter sp. A1]RXV63682.1 succinylglutamate desuccinylase [Fusibacter sp. A1]